MRTEIPLKSVVAEGTTQMRGYDESLVARYAEQVRDGAIFPPVDVFKDGDDYYLGDGFHRVGAWREAGYKSVAANVHEIPEGETAQRAAILFAVGANDAHGRNRTDADKRRAVEALLKDPDWSKWTDREIARQCRVGHQLVGRHRARLVNQGSLEKAEARTRKDKHGNVTKINTANIGRKTAEPPTQAGSEPSPQWTADDEHTFLVARDAYYAATDRAQERLLIEIQQGSAA